MSSSCIHITALLFRVDAANRSGMTNPACTSRQCVWNVPSEKTVIKPTKIADMNWKSSKLNKEPSRPTVDSRRSLFQPVEKKRALNDNERRRTFYENLKDAFPDSCFALMGQAECTPELLQPTTTPRESNILSSDEIDVIEEIIVGPAENEAWHQQKGDGITASNVYRVLTNVESVSPAECTPEPLQPISTPRESTILSSDLNDIREENPVVTTFTLDSLSPMKPLPPSLDEIRERGKAIKRKLQFTDDEIDSVEKKTKLQSDSIDWFKYRTGRITASHCKRIASLKSTTSPTKALREVLSYNQVPLTAAMKEGLEKEDEIEQALIKYMKQNGHSDIRVEKCGFVISETHGHIGASPDRIMYDQSESSPGVVEMKFLQVKSGETLEDILLKQHICRKRSNSIALNRNHKYFYQLHQQMFATTYPWGIFVACGRDGGIYVEKVLFDQEFWSPVLVKLNLFFDSVILPELAFPKVKYGQNRTVLQSTDK